MENESQLVNLYDIQQIGGIKRFSKFPYTPISAPDEDYHVANKKYVDDSFSSSGLITASGDQAAPEYAKWVDKNTLEGRTAVEVRSDLELSTRYLSISGNNANVDIDIGAHDFKTTSFTVGANTLNTTEFALLDGQDQAVKTDSYVSFNKISETTKWGGINALGNNTYWEVELLAPNLFIQMPRLVAVGSGFTPAAGAIANLLYLHSNVGVNPTLLFSNYSTSVNFRLVMDEITGEMVVTRNGGTTNAGTTWTDKFYSVAELKSGAGRIKNTTRVTTTYTILVTDDTVFCNTDGGAFAVTLPAGAEGQTLRIINSGTSGNDLTVTPNSTEHLTGVNASKTASDGTVVLLTYNATDGWY